MSQTLRFSQDGNSQDGEKGIPRRRLAFHTLIAAVAAVLIVAAPAAGQNHHESSTAPEATAFSAPGQTILGDVVPVGNGTGRSWVQVDGAGKPTAVGITLTEAALNGLAADVTPGLIWVAEYILAFPTDVSGLPFNHVGLNWNPKGHIPNGIYNVPHFDVHFYTISPGERSRITARGDDLDVIRKVPATGNVPDGYVFAPESEEPGMGGHWVDPGSHEFHGQAFTTTFLYGTYDGEIIFYEPMITKSYLESKPDVVMPIKVPTTYAHAGYYPMSYSIRYDAKRKEYVVALEGLTLRTAS